MAIQGLTIITKIDDLDERRSAVSSRISRQVNRYGEIGVIYALKI